MEPFELKLHQVTFEESDGNSPAQGHGQTHPQLDSFSSLVHYDANFQDSSSTPHRSESASGLQDLTFCQPDKQGKRPSVSSPSFLCNTTTYTTTTLHRSTSASTTSPSPRTPLPWERQYVGDAESQEHFLINPDDYFLPPSHSVGKVSPEVAAAGLRTLSQVSINTSAVARHLRKVKGGKRRVAKTTLTSTALASPGTMPSETPQPSTNPGAATVATSDLSGGDVEGEGGGDSSFETVAEALRLQWSVIGNASVTPASPDEVARIVAEAEKRLRGSTGKDNPGNPSPLPQLPASDLAASTITSVGSLSSLSSLSSSATNDNGVAGAEASVETSEPAYSAGLVRIPAQSISHEVEKASWFRSKTTTAASSQPSQDGVPKTSAESSDSIASTSTLNSSQVKGNESGALTKGVRDLPLHAPKSVPFGTGAVSPTDLSFQSPTGSTPYASPSVQSPDVFPHGSSYQTAGQTSSFYQQAAPQSSSSHQQPAPSQLSPHWQNDTPVHHSAVSQSVGDRQGNVSVQYSSVSSSFAHGQNEAVMQHSAMSQSAVATLQHVTPTQQVSGPSPMQSHSSSTQPSPQPTASQSVDANFNPALQMSAPLPSQFNPPLPHIGPLFPKKVGGGSGGVVGVVRGGNEGGTFDDLMKEKLKLEGQVEILQSEAQATLQDRAQLQAQLASLQLKLKSGQQKVDDAEKASLRAELERLRASRMDHEREAVEVQQMLEEKMEELKNVTEDLFQSQDSVDKLQVRMKELRDDLQAREVTTQALKSKIAELYVEVQTTLQSKMEADSEARTARNDLVSLVKAKEWYQEQLSAAHEVRARLQRQLTQLQAQTVAQGSIVERLKLESGRLRQQLRDSQERALRDKEQLARHLEAIQQDMMDREAAFQEIQRERLMIEDTFNTQVTTVEEEKSRISNLLQLTGELESQLEQAHSNSKKKQEQIFGLENEQMDLMKKTALVQEVLVEKEQLLDEANQRLIEVESQLQVYTKTLATKDTELLKLREDKASTEIALKAALQEKQSVDKALDMLKGDMGKVEKSFKQMRQELGTRMTELEAARTQHKTARDELDRVAHELDIKTRSVDSLTQNHQQQTAVIEQLRAEKTDAEKQVELLREQLQEQAQSMKSTDSESQQALQAELQETRARLTEAENQLHITSSQLQKASAAAVQETSDQQLQTVMAEKDSLVQQLQRAQEERSTLEMNEQKLRERLEEEVASLKNKLTEGKTEFERVVQSHVEQLHQVAEDKKRLETELEMSQRKFELTSVQQQETINAEIQKLMRDLEAAQHQQQDLEHQLHQLHSQKHAEVSALQQELDRTRQALQDATQQQQHLQDTAAFNQQLALDLEKERGRIAGLQQSNSTLKDHMKQLEEALAGRESTLVELNSHVESGQREREKEQQEYLRRIQELEVSLKKAKDAGRDLRKQIGSKITENKRLQKQHDAHKKEQGELQEEVERRQKDATHVRGELDSVRQLVRDKQEEVQSLQQEKHALEAELERVRRELTDNADRNPVLMEQIQSLEWQVSQRSQEVEAARQQLTLAEDRQTSEMDSMRQALQDKQDEIDSLQGELAAVRQEKADQKSRVSELRSVLKASVQHHKLTKKLNVRKRERGAGDADSREEKATQADMGNGVIIPPLPFDMDAVEQLLLDTAVKPLDSKPLDNLSTCLSSLRAEISGLQKQMEVHTSTIHTSTLSWRIVESEVKGLQEVVKSIANTIMDSKHTTTTTTTAAADTEMVDDGSVVHL